MTFLYLPFVLLLPYQHQWSPVEQAVEKVLDVGVVLAEVENPSTWNHTKSSLTLEAKSEGSVLQVRPSFLILWLEKHQEVHTLL